MQLLVVATLLVVTTLSLPYLLYLGLYGILRPHGSPAAKQPAEPSVSIVLPTFNEAGIVESKLSELCSLDYPMAKVELVVVDASDDETPTIVQGFFADREVPELTLIQEETRRGLAPALNDAYQTAKNEMVVKTDCDSRLANDVLREAAANLADPAIAAVTGRNSEVLGGSAVEAGYRGIQAHIQTLESHLDSTLIFHGPFSAFENAEIVPIDPNSLADDSELALRIRRNGKRVIFDPAIRYMEAAHSDFAKRRKQKDRRALGLVRLLIQQRDALFTNGRFGWVVLPFNWWFMLLSPGLLTATLLFGTGAALSVFGWTGFLLPIAIVWFGWLGQRDALGPIQPLYALLDTQVSLLRATGNLLRGQSDGTWEVDPELREAYE